MVGRTGVPAGVLVVAAGFCTLAALVFFVSSAASQNGPRVTKAFHATKDCSGFTGLVGAYCTIRSSNVKALKVGSKIFYAQMAGKTALDSDTVIYVSRAASQPAIASFVSRPGSDCARSRTAREHLPDSVSECVSRPVRRSRSCGTWTGRTASIGASSVGKRPVTERVGRWLSSLSAKYIAVFALLVAVPVICTSVYLLYSSYQDNKRALTRLQQEKAKSVAVTIDQYFIDLTNRMKATWGRYLSLTALGSVLQPLLEDNATEAFYIDSTGRKTLASAGGGLARVKGSFLHDRAVERTRAAGVYFGPVYAPRLLSNPGARSMEIMVSETPDTASLTGTVGTGVVGATMDLVVVQDLVRQTRLGTSGYVYAIDTKGVPIAHPNASAFTQRFFGSSSGDGGAGFVEDGIDGRP